MRRPRPRRGAPVHPDPESTSHHTPSSRLSYREKQRGELLPYSTWYQRPRRSSRRPAAELISAAGVLLSPSRSLLPIAAERRGGLQLRGRLRRRREAAARGRVSCWALCCWLRGSRGSGVAGPLHAAAPFALLLASSLC